MMASPAEEKTATWTVPQCPFAICYSLRALDDIRLAVTDAFFSLPRGGAEIGGLLLGKLDGGQVVISNYVPLDVEHAFGPSFSLSPRDEGNLAELLRQHEGNVAGWYHSHTRSEIFLSEADQAIHNRLFPETWQIALVLKPHTFLPTRAGFFFREARGTIHGDASYQEFELETMPLRPLPTGEPPMEPAHQRMDAAIGGPVIDVESRPAEPEARNELEIAAEPALKPELPKAEPVDDRVVAGFDATPVSFDAAPDIEPRSARAEKAAEPEEREEPEDTAAPERDLKLPGFAAAAAPESASRRWWIGALCVLLGSAMGAWAYKTRSLWIPGQQEAGANTTATTSAPAPAAPVPAPYIGLTAVEKDGGLQIRWDRNSPAIRSGSNAVLTITDGPVPRTVPLDQEHLLSGSVVYVRKTERVELTMTLQTPGGQPLREATQFQGALPATATQDSTLIHRLGDLITQNEKLKSDLIRQTDRARKAEKALEEMRAASQRKRLGNQVPDLVK